MRLEAGVGAMDELPAEASFDTEVSPGDVVLEWRGGFDDSVILNVES
jgi:hypothetical protein